MAGCGAEDDLASLLPDVSSAPPEGYTPLLRIAHISDTHLVDEQSPARLAGFAGLIASAWRPQEAYSAQLLDGTIRAINRRHREAGPIDCVIHTGDATDSCQQNELRWFTQVFDGLEVDPLTGPDDRDPDNRPPVLLDPHHPFRAEGLYVQGRHGDLPSVPWLNVFGNHDTFAMGTFAIVERDGARVAPLPLDWRPGWVLPTILVPHGEWTYCPVSPADPGPPSLFERPVRVQANPERAYLSAVSFLEQHFATVTEPPGHGFVSTAGPRYYARLLKPNLRLIALNTADVPCPLEGFPYAEGAISRSQLRWLRGQLDEAQAQGQWVIVASHHTSQALSPLLGSAVDPGAFRSLLGGYGNVILHMVGHTHINRVHARGGYVEIVTGSLLDYPQTGRIVEVHVSPDARQVVVSYATFSHLESDDPLHALRQEAHTLSKRDAPNAAMRAARALTETAPEDADAVQWLSGSPSDREGRILLRK